MIALLENVTRVLYLFSPVFASAALSAFVHRNNWLPWLARPIDGGRMWRAKRLLGDGKTWRGVAIAVAASIVMVAIQKYCIGERGERFAVIDYASASPLWLGTAIGGGAMLGELPNSFVKRRLGIGRGKTAQRPILRAIFYLWDQIDLVLGVWPLLTFWTPIRLDLVATSIVIAAVLHPLVAWIGFVIGARQSAR